MKLSVTSAAFLTFTPDFSQAIPTAQQAETVQTVSSIITTDYTRLKPGVNSS